MKTQIRSRKDRECYPFILPAFIYLLVVVGYPIVYNFVLSFKNTNVKNLASGSSVFIGFQNYKELFTDPNFLLILRNTFIFTIAAWLSNLRSAFYSPCFSIKSLLLQARSAV